MEKEIPVSGCHCECRVQRDRFASDRARSGPVSVLRVSADCKLHHTGDHTLAWSVVTRPELRLKFPRADQVCEGDDKELSWAQH